MSEPHRIRAATSIHKLHCKKFFQTGKKSLKRRNLWELPRFRVLNLK
ncbi:hypothetical protein LEP1GSC070_2873 [Leptospira santarosai str. AIM]|uniref:Uncharacterized protein n=1 Tax=Leptospira santarosai serovar Arenal str. MAVJ 401 TaxID=1049976 RepID=M6JUI6_9LEPT|nr:hypothetical protein LEP1GSC063_0506 [Leptospira santarosai serovar Arenal str. MAVJ 401]EMO84974.1 hypothetical protein LEP1GSC070_2873 [Leptospira santarosai str. AIM]